MGLSSLLLEAARRQQGVLAPLLQCQGRLTTYYGHATPYETHPPHHSPDEHLVLTPHGDNPLGDPHSPAIPLTAAEAPPFLSWQGATRGILTMALLTMATLTSRASYGFKAGGDGTVT